MWPFKNKEEKKEEKKEITEETVLLRDVLINKSVEFKRDIWNFQGIVKEELRAKGLCLYKSYSGRGRTFISVRVIKEGKEIIIRNERIDQEIIGKAFCERVEIIKKKEGNEALESLRGAK